MKEISPEGVCTVRRAAWNSAGVMAFSCLLVATLT
jgi:hypothetical protein